MNEIGKYMVFEGCEGSGKDTQIELLSNVLQWRKKLFVASTKEPGGTPTGKKFRSFLLNEEHVPAVGEVFLFLTDRVVNISSFVIPNLIHFGFRVLYIYRQNFQQIWLSSSYNSICLPSFLA